MRKERGEKRDERKNRINMSRVERSCDHSPRECALCHMGFAYIPPSHPRINYLIYFY